jgi:hypothetical protein
MPLRTEDTNTLPELLICSFASTEANIADGNPNDKKVSHSCCQEMVGGQRHVIYIKPTNTETKRYGGNNNREKEYR